MLYVFLASTELGAYESGKLAGTFVRLVIILAGIIKCFQISRRKETSTLCSIALGLVLMAWLTISISSIIKCFYHNPDILFNIAVLFIALICLSGGFVTAIIGLVDYKNHPEYCQGRKQGIWSIVLAIVFGSLIIVGFVGGIRKGRPEPGSSLSVLRKEPYSFEQLNFTLSSPGHPWVEMNASKINPAATLMFSRRNPEIIFTIIAEEIGSTHQLTSEILAEIAKTNLRGVAANVKVIKEMPYTLNGLSGTWMDIDASLANKRVSYVYWVISHNGYVYQLIVGGINGKREEVNKTAKKLHKHFSLIDMSRVSQAGGHNYGTFTSDLFQYTVDLSDTGWMEWENVCADNPEAETGGALGLNNTGFLIVPFVCDTGKPELNAIMHMYLRSIGLESSEKVINNIHDGHEFGMQTRSFEFSRTIDEAFFYYKARIWTGSNRSFFAWTWSTKDDDEFRKEAKNLFANILFRNQDNLPAVTVNDLPDNLRTENIANINYLGLYYLDEEKYDMAIRLFEHAFELMPQKDLYLSNTLYAYSHAGRYKDGLAYLNKAGKDKKAPEIQAWHAWYLVQLGKKNEAITIYKNIFKQGHDDLEDLKDYTRLLAEKEAWKDVDQAFDLYSKKNQSLTPQLARAGIYAEYEKFPESIKILKKAQEKISFNPEIAFQLISNYSSLEQYSEALTVCDNLISNGYTSASVYHEKASAEYGLRWYRRAKTSLEKAAKFSPNNEDIAEFLKQVSGMLGEGENSMIKTVIVPVPLPKIVADQLPDPKARKLREDCSAVTLYDVTGFSFERDKHLKATRYKHIHILDANGVSKYSTLEANFDPLNERLYVNKLEIRNKNGETISTGNVTDYYVIDKQNTDMITHDKTLHMPVPNLAPDCTIKLVLTRENFGDVSEFYLERRFMASRRPCLWFGCYAIVKNAKLRHHAANGIKTKAIPGGQLWYVENPPAYIREPFEPTIENTLPVLVLADASLSWKTEAQEYLKFISKNLTITDPVRKLAQELTAQSKSKEDKINKILQHVQDNYTYKPLEFGIRGNLPYPAGETIRNRYGDCKDYSLLIHQLLKAVDIPSSLAMVNSEYQTLDSLPSLDQFDHVIVHIPDKAGCKFADATLEHYDIRKAPPLGLAGRKALVLDPDNPKLVRIDDYAPDSSRFVNRYDIHVHKNRKLTVNDTLILSGYYAGWMRRIISKKEKNTRAQWMQEVLNSYENGAELLSFNVLGLNDFTKDLILETKYILDGHCEMRKKDIFVSLPNVWIRDYFQIQPVLNRQKPFKIYYPLVFNATVVVHNPEGYEFLKSDPKTHKEKTSAAQWSYSIKHKPGRYQIDLNGTLNAGQYPESKYKNHRISMDHIIEIITEELHCRPSETQKNSN
ncbi:DUF3857 domain-containing protein [Verrucomicrobiota bacterium]